ncbi:O-acetylhomoserine aminocarboxypropyltransferase/cysteine synthase family protein [Fimbriimonas ginsengisoli]|uniref:O-acetylhomoserine aminocarboxypropyltransferase/cysteine synthase family protein n=1 Tax=Fimbriimonas ginsengisoli TaxID=1005039 RepID=UPI00046CDAB1|nr:O-acetylhomoserine aminocarboxypropyltransferase/cysteine synthase [Fimbriimonas ginsengisoli]
MPKNFETLALHGGQTVDPGTKARAVPIYQTTSYVFDDTSHAARLFALEEFGNLYTRVMNPTTDVFEQRMAALEGGTHAVATASGQAAETLAITMIAEAGDEVISSTSLYGGTYNLFHYTLPKYGIKVKFVDPSDPENFRRAITDKTKLIYGESVGNPRLDTFPFAEVSAIAKQAGIPIMIDNTFPTPYLLKPFEHGANIVVHSATKFIGGHGTSIGGVVIDGGNFDWGASGRFKNFTDPDPSYHGLKFWEVFGNFPGLGNVAFGLKARVQGLRDTGGCISPFNSFLLLQGLETLHLRMERHSTNGKRVAEFLQGHPQVKWVTYPGLSSHPDHATAAKYHYRGQYGAIIGFGIEGGYDAALKFIDGLQIFSLLANVGDAKSLVIHPASTTHQQLSEAEQQSAGVTPDFIRLSVGLENVDDILADLDQALSLSK